MEFCMEKLSTEEDPKIAVAGQNSSKTGLLYKVDDQPPWALCALLGLQHYLTMFGSVLGMPFILAPHLCFEDKPEVISQLISTFFFCSGIITLLQTTFGVRLPIVQGSTFAFLAPVVALMSAKGPCPTKETTSLAYNQTSNHTVTVIPEWKQRMLEVQGSIMVASMLQVIVGFSGLIGFVLKYIGPLTIAPTIALVALPLFETVGNFIGVQWGIASLTAICITVFSQVLHNIPIKIFTKKIYIFKLLPILLSICAGWLLSFILTISGVFEEGSPARTDFRGSVVTEADWFSVPYPCQWGVPRVTTAGVIGMLAGVLASMVESVGDYYACARVAEAPTPPNHALNRGVAVEGLGCFITGIMGTGNGTTSFSQNIGAVGLTRVASLRVIQCGAMFMIVLSVFSKFGALFSTVPSSVIGGSFLIMFSMVTAFGLSSLQFVDLNSMRNLFVLGTALFVGMVIPHWVKSNTERIDVGVVEINQIIRVLLMTNMAVGGFTGFILDNLLPGTKEERGIVKWQNNLSPDGCVTKVSSIHVYDPPFLSKRFMESKICYYIPFLPYYQNSEQPETSFFENTNF